jgi:glucokinase
MNRSTSQFLVAEIGSTNSRIAQSRGVAVDFSSIRKFKNSDYSGFQDILGRYCESLEFVPDAVCVSIAGPVINGKGSLTNIDWSVDSELLCSVSHSSKGYVLGDLQAEAYSTKHVSSDPIIVSAPDSTKVGVSLIAGVGTGFNAVPIHTTIDGPYVPPSEYGRSSFPTWDDASLAVYNSIKRRHGFASVEDALSPRGLIDMLSYFGSNRSINELAEAFVDAGNDPEGPEAQALRMFSEGLGRVLGDLALEHLPFGGIFLTGGVARALGPWLNDSYARFSRGFEDKGRFSGFMKNFSVSLIRSEGSALVGCAAYADIDSRESSRVIQRWREGPYVDGTERDHFDMLRELEVLLEELSERLRSINDPVKVTNNIRYIRAASDSMLAFISSFEDSEISEVPTDLPIGLVDRLRSLDLSKADRVSVIAQRIADIVSKIFL